MSAHPLQSRRARPVVFKDLLPLAKWPNADRIAWLRALEPHDVFDRSGRAFRWAHVTKGKVQTDYSRWLCWLTHVYPNELSMAAPIRVTPARVTEFIQTLEQYYRVASISSFIDGLWMSLSAIAPFEDFDWLKVMANKMHGRAERSATKSIQVKHSSDLFNLGLTLMARAESAYPKSARKTCLGFRDGLMIALLAARPLRVRNFQMMEIGRHLVRATDGYSLLFERTETKQGVALYWRIPAALTQSLDRYLATYRPHFLANSKSESRNRYCWLTWSGKLLCRTSISNRLIRLTRAEFGFPISPHRFRHCAVTSIAIDDPAAMAMAPNVLGNFDFETTEEHYNQSMMFHGSRRYQTAIADLRAALSGLTGDDFESRILAATEDSASEKP